MKTVRTTVLCLKCYVNQVFKVIKVELKRKVWGVRGVRTETKDKKRLCIPN